MPRGKISTIGEETNFRALMGDTQHVESLGRGCLYNFESRDPQNGSL